MPATLEAEYTQQLESLRPASLEGVLAEAATQGEKDAEAAGGAGGSAEGDEGATEAMKASIEASADALPELRKRMEAALEKMGRVVAACQAEKSRSDIASPATTPAAQTAGGSGGKVAVRTRLAAAARARAAPY